MSRPTCQVVGSSGVEPGPHRADQPAARAHGPGAPRLEVGRDLREGLHERRDVEGVVGPGLADPARAAEGEQLGGVGRRGHGDVEAGQRTGRRLRGVQQVGPPGGRALEPLLVAPRGDGGVVARQQDRRDVARDPAGETHEAGLV